MHHRLAKGEKAPNKFNFDQIYAFEQRQKAH